jgi:hypothetical protein
MAASSWGWLNVLFFDFHPFFENLFACFFSNFGTFHNNLLEKKERGFTYFSYSYNPSPKNYPSFYIDTNFFGVNGHIISSTLYAL